MNLGVTTDYVATGSRGTLGQWNESWPSSLSSIGVLDTCHSCWALPVEVVDEESVALQTTSATAKIWFWALNSPEPTSWLLSGAVALGLVFLIPTWRALADASRRESVYRPFWIVTVGGAVASLVVGWTGPAPWLLALLLVAVLGIVWAVVPPCPGDMIWPQVTERRRR